MTLILGKRENDKTILVADSCYADGDLYLPYGKNQPKIEVLENSIAIASAGTASIGQQLKWFADKYFDGFKVTPDKSLTSVDAFEFFQKFRTSQSHLASDINDKSQDSVHFLLATAYSLHEVCDDGFVQSYDVGQIAAIGCGAYAAYPLILYGAEDLLKIAETVSQCIPHVTPPFCGVTLKQ